MWAKSGRNSSLSQRLQVTKFYSTYRQHLYKRFQICCYKWLIWVDRQTDRPKKHFNKRLHNEVLGAFYGNVIPSSQWISFGCCKNTRVSENNVWLCGVRSDECQYVLSLWKDCWWTVTSISQFPCVLLVCWVTANQPTFRDFPIPITICKNCLQKHFRCLS